MVDPGVWIIKDIQYLIVLVISPSIFVVYVIPKEPKRFKIAAKGKTAIGNCNDLPRFWKALKHFFYISLILLLELGFLIETDKSFFCLFFKLILDTIKIFLFFI